MKQELSSFEFAESLPLSLGIVIDGSGSMKESMPLVHQAASEFVAEARLEGEGPGLRDRVPRAADAPRRP